MDVDKSVYRPMGVYIWTLICNNIYFVIDIIMRNYWCNVAANIQRYYISNYTTIAIIIEANWQWHCITHYIYT
jgi:hypothetical protein